MKTVLLLALCALFGTAYGENDTDLVYKYVNCAIRAATVGIKGLIPPHNPLQIHDVSFNQTVLGLNYKFDMTNVTLFSLMDLELKQVDVHSYTNPGAVDIDYDIYWKVLNFTGDFDWSADIFGAEIGENGSFNIILHHTDFTGLFNLTKPGQKGVKEHLDDFTLKISVKDVEAHIHGDGPEFLTENLIQFVLKLLLNNVPSSAADFLKEQRFNDFWIGHPERIDKVIQWCHDNPAV